MGAVTYVFRRITAQLFRLVRQSVSALNQNLQENLAGLAVVQLSERQEFNKARYRGLNAHNRDVEKRSIGIETLYGAFTDSVSSIADFAATCTARSRVFSSFDSASCGTLRSG